MQMFKVVDPDSKHCNQYIINAWLTKQTLCSSQSKVVPKPYHPHKTFFTKTKVKSLQYEETRENGQGADSNGQELIDSVDHNHCEFLFLCVCEKHLV